MTIARKTLDRRAFLGGTGKLNKGEPIEIPKPSPDQLEVVEHDGVLPVLDSADGRGNAGFGSTGVK